MAAGAEGGGVPLVGGNAQGGQTQRRGSEEIQAGSGSTDGRERRGGELRGNLRPDIVTAGSDGGSEQDVEAARVGKSRRSRLQDAGDQTAPSGMEERDPLGGRGKEHGDAIGGTHGEDEAGNPAPCPVARGDLSRMLAAGHVRAVHLAQKHRLAIGQRPRGLRQETAAQKAHLRDSRRRGIGAKYVGSQLEGPDPAHDGAA